MEHASMSMIKTIRALFHSSYAFSRKGHPPSTDVLVDTSSRCTFFLSADFINVQLFLSFVNLVLAGWVGVLTHTFCYQNI